MGLPVVAEENDHGVVGKAVQVWRPDLLGPVAAQWFDKLTTLGSTSLTTLSLSKGSTVEGMPHADPDVCGPRSRRTISKTR